MIYKYIPGVPYPRTWHCIEHCIHLGIHNISKPLVFVWCSFLHIVILNLYSVTLLWLLIQKFRLIIIILTTPLWFWQTLLKKIFPIVYIVLTSTIYLHSYSGSIYNWFPWVLVLVIWYNVSSRIGSVRIFSITAGPGLFRLHPQKGLAPFAFITCHAFKIWKGIMYPVFLSDLRLDTLHKQRRRKICLLIFEVFWKMYYKTTYRMYKTYYNKIKHREQEWIILGSWRSGAYLWNLAI